MAKKIVRLTESQLHNVISESVNKILNELFDTKAGQNMAGRLAAQKNKDEFHPMTKEYNSSIEGKKIEDYAKKQAHRHNLTNYYGEQSFNDAYKEGYDNEMNFMKAYDTAMDLKNKAQQSVRDMHYPKTTEKERYQNKRKMYR